MIDITPEEARAELERRRALRTQQNSTSEVNITPEEARAELARRKQQKIEKIKNITGIGKTPFDTLRDLASGVVVGLGKGGQFIAETLTGGNAPTVDFNQIQEAIKSPKQSIGGDIVKGIGEYLPYGLAGGSSLLGQVAAGGTHGAATNDSNDQNLFGYLPSGKMGSAIEEGLINALTHGAFKGLEALRPSKLLRGSLSPEELKANLEAAEGTPTGLGDVIGSPFLKRQYENILTKVPFSNANEKMMQAASNVKQKGNDILVKMLGENDPENVNEQIYSQLIKQFEEHQQKKNNLYNKFNEEANKQFLNLPLKNFASKAKEYKDAIESTNILKLEPDLKRILTKLGIYENPVIKATGDKGLVNQFGQNLIGENLNTYILPTAQEANLLKGRLNHYANVYKSSPDPEKRYISGIFNDLSKSLKSDINNAVEKSGNKNLEQVYRKAEENYAKNFSPFLDKQIYKFIGGKADPDTIVQNFLKTSRSTDRSQLLSKLTTKLPPQQRSLIAYSYFSPALDNVGNFNPSKLNTLIKGLGKNQFKALIPDSSIRKELENYSKLYKMNVRGINAMENPMTGQQNTDAIVQSLLGAGSAIGTGGLLGGLGGAIGAGMLPVIGSRLLVKQLTNHAFRDALVKAMIENKSWDPNIITALQTGLQGTVNRK